MLTKFSVDIVLVYVDRPQTARPVSAGRLRVAAAAAAAVDPESNKS